MYSFIVYDTLFIRRMRFITEPRTGNKASKLKVLHENSRTYDGMWPTISHLLSPKQHSMIRVVPITHINTKRKPLTKAGSPNIPVLVHDVVATYDDFQGVLGFLCRHVLGSLLDVHAWFDTFAAYKYNGMIRGYTENLVIKRIPFCCDHLYRGV